MDGRALDLAEHAPRLPELIDKLDGVDIRTFRPGDVTAFDLRLRRLVEAPELRIANLGSHVIEPLPSYVAVATAGAYAGALGAPMTRRSDTDERAERLRRSIRDFMNPCGLAAWSWCKSAGLSPNVLPNFLEGRTRTLNYETLERLAESQGVTVSGITEPSAAAHLAKLRIIASKMNEARALLDQLSGDINDHQAPSNPEL